MPDTRERHHLALALAHRWFGYLETSWGDTETQLEIFVDDVVLSGRRGGIVFANDHASMRKWFDAIPDDTSAHRIIHHSWNDTGERSGILDFLVAYQVPGRDRPGGSVISYTTVVVFDDDGQARFARLDKTPVLPNEDPEYHPTWAEHRVLAAIHSALAGHHGDDGLAELARAVGGDAEVEVWAPVPAPARKYSAVILAKDERGDVRTSHWTFTDTPHSVLPVATSREPLPRSSRA